MFSAFLSSFLTSELLIALNDVVLLAPICHTHSIQHGGLDCLLLLLRLNNRPIIVKFLQSEVLCGFLNRWESGPHFYYHLFSGQLWFLLLLLYIGLARSLSILLMFSKNHLLVILIFFSVSISHFFISLILAQIFIIPSIGSFKKCFLWFLLAKSRFFF